MARPEAAVAQERGYLAGGGGVGAEHEQAASLVQGGGESSGRSADEGDDLDVLQGPAEAGAGVGEGGGVREDVYGVGAEFLDEGAPYAVEQGIPAGQHGDRATGVRSEQAGDRGPQG